MSADKVDSESFMLACLKMAKAYVRIVQGELTLYASKPGHVPLETNFRKLTASIEERIVTHTALLEKAKTPEKPKVQLKQRDVELSRCAQCGGDSESGHQRLCSVELAKAPKNLVPQSAVHRPKLKKRKV